MNACTYMIFGMLFHECGMLFYKCGMWNALHTHIQCLVFSLNVNSEKPVMFWEFEATKCMDSVCSSSSCLTSKCWDKNHVRACVFRGI